MEKISKEEQRRGSSRWINVLTFLTVIQTAVFLSVTLVTFLDVLDIDQKEADLRHGIQKLESNLKGPAIDTEEARPSPEATLERIKRHIRARIATRQSAPLFTDMLKVQDSYDEAIFEKHCHDVNKTCPQGSKGDQGPRGAQGTDGATGIFGFGGKTGPRGPKGQPGLKGTIGQKGLKGERGPSGGSGISGLPGPSGEEGVNGTKGEPGLDGQNGVTGDPGGRGDVGITGSPGLNKTQGQQGDRGDPGIKGSQGDPGIQGQKGNDSRKFADDCDCFTKPSFIPANDAIVQVSLQTTKELPCNATGNPVPTVTVSKVSSGKRNVISDGSKVMVSNASSADYARYMCEARNQFGSATKYIDIKPAAGK